MPDSHWGLGACVGSVIALKKAVIPAAVESISVWECWPAKPASIPTTFLKTSRPCAQKSKPMFPMERHWQRKKQGSWCLGFSENSCPCEKQKKKIEGWFDGYRLDCGGISKWLNRRHPITHLGTLGTGNHFIELCLDEKDHVWIMLHSGSRGIGNSVGTHFINKAKEEMGTGWGLCPTKIVHT